MPLPPPPPMVLLTPIQLTATEYLEQPVSMIPIVGLTDSSPLPTDYLGELGIHSTCRGIMHLIPVAPGISTVCCRRCGFRESVPSSGLSTYGNLRARTPVRTLRQGSGDPNGVVVGFLGDLYVDVLGGSNQTLYVKEHDDGLNTGWHKLS